MLHADLTGADAVHQAAFVSNTDPGAVGANKFWIDTSAGTGAYVLKVRNAANDAWLSATAGATSGVASVNGHTGAVVLGASDVSALPSATPTFTNYRETVTTPAIASGVLALDHATGNVFDVALNANITSLTGSNFPAAGVAYSWTLRLTTSGSFAVTWPTAFRFAGGTAPTLPTTSGKRISIVCFTTDGGTSIDAVATDVF